MPLSDYFISGCRTVEKSGYSVSHLFIGVPVCHSILVEVRGQPTGVFSIMLAPEAKLRLSRLCSKCLSLLGHLTSPTPLLSFIWKLSFAEQEINCVPEAAVLGQKQNSNPGTGPPTPG